jgi:tetratricopeptide (TPR) repeat protein
VQRRCLLGLGLALLLSATAIAAQRSPSAASAFGEGHALAADRDYPKAIAAWLRALSADPTYWEAHQAIAEVYIATKKPHDALHHLESAEAIQPGDTQTQRLASEARKLIAEEEAKLAALTFNKDDLAFIGGNPDRARWLLKMRGSFARGEKLSMKPPPLGLSAIDLDRIAYAVERRQREASASQDSVEYDATTGNWYRVTRTGGRTDLLGWNFKTGSEWNVSWSNGIAEGRDKEGRAFLWDPETTLFTRSDGVFCLGIGAQRRCSQPK